MMLRMGERRRDNTEIVKGEGSVENAEGGEKRIQINE